MVTLLTTTNAPCQVNVEPFREHLVDGFGMRVAGSSTVRGGNTQGIELGVNVLVRYRSGRHFAYATGSGDYARYAQETTIAKAFGHARYNYELTRWATAELFAQAERDEFRRIQVRELVGTGPRWTLASAEVFSLHWGQAYMLEYTERDSSARADGEQDIAHRLSSYLSVQLEVHERIAINSVTYYQPRLDDWGDYRILSMSGATFEVTERLASRVDVTLRYESHVPFDLKPFDYEAKHSLQLSF